jgi:histidinol-phosphate aminotransferase
MNWVHGGEVWDFAKKPIDFSANINPLGLSPLALKALENWKIVHYPPPYPEKLKSKIADYVGVGVENVTIGNGSMELIKDVCCSFLKKKDATLILGPTFSEYKRFSKIFGKDAKELLPEKDFDYNVNEILRAIDENTRIIFICRPNNPTGSMMPEEGIRKILEFTKERGILLFIDEAFIEFSGARSLAPCIEEFENLFVLRSFTKFFALPGLRIGYGIGSARIIKKLEVLKSPWNINIFAHDAAITSLKDQTYVRKTKKFLEREKTFIKREVEKLGITAYASRANYFLLKYNWNSKEVKEELLLKGILIRDCSNFFGLDTRFIRVSIRNRVDNLKLVGALRNYLLFGMKRGRECKYYPCHFEDQDCTFCFCPFFPCEDNTKGEFIVGKKRGKVWTCKNCNDIHKLEIVEKISKNLGKNDLKVLDLKARLVVKNEVMQNF